MVERIGRKQLLFFVWIAGFGYLLPLLGNATEDESPFAVAAISAPSAVDNIDVASCALRTACVNPLICEDIFEEIARPAASSAAELILSPVDSRSIA